MKLAVLCEDPNHLSLAQALAHQFHIPIFSEENDSYEIYFVIEEDHIGLKVGGSRQKPIFVDFLAGSLAYRIQHANGKKQLLPRAVGLHHRPHLYIVDVTAGLGRDAFVLASLGAMVHLLERSPVMATLLKDGLRRAKAVSCEIISRIQLTESDAKDFLMTEDQTPDVIYLDPMFPERRSALNKKEMRIIKSIVGEDEDAPELLQLALNKAARVVVKRPRLAAPLGGLKPSYILKGASSRFDVYLR